MFSGQVFEFARHYENACISVSLLRCRHYVKINHKNAGTCEPGVIYIHFQNNDNRSFGSGSSLAGSDKKNPGYRSRPKKTAFISFMMKISDKKFQHIEHSNFVMTFVNGQQEKINSFRFRICLMLRPDPDPTKIHEYGSETLMVTIIIYKISKKSFNWVNIWLLYKIWNKRFQNDVCYSLGSKQI